MALHLCNDPLDQISLKSLNQFITNGPISLTQTDGLFTEQLFLAIAFGALPLSIWLGTWIGKIKSVPQTLVTIGITLLSIFGVLWMIVATMKPALASQSYGEFLQVGMQLENFSIGSFILAGILIGTIINGILFQLIHRYQPST